MAEVGHKIAPASDSPNGVRMVRASQNAARQGRVAADPPA